jgi:inner membrane protein
MLAALRNSTHILTHILFGVLAWVVVNFGHPIDPLLLIVVAAGALLPDVDVSTSFVGRSVRPLSKWLEARFGHRQEVHSIWAVLVVAGLAWPLRFIPGVGVEMWLALLVGWCSHLILDLLNPAGIAFLLPLSNARVHLLGGKVRQNEPSEKILLVVLVLAVAGALWVSGVGTSQLLHAVLPVPDLARESYRDWEGRYRVYADIDGTWQDGTHRRVEGRHEVLGLRGQDFTLRDPESEAEFVAGRSVNAEVYLNRGRPSPRPADRPRPHPRPHRRPSPSVSPTSPTRRARSRYGPATW